jgi:hypothetical protein
MRLFLFLIFFLMMLINTMAQYTDKRQVLIFGPAKGTQVMAQWALLEKDSAGLRERDMFVLLAAGEKALYQKFGVAAAEPFLILLVGKDGGEKYRSKELTNAQQLFGLVDAMPMRRAEMRRGKKAE